jgi:protein-tyrosine-phosphatase
MAEAIARHWLGEAGHAGAFFVASAGVFAAEGVPASVETVAALAGLGIEHEGRSKPLTAEMVRKADLVLCMTASHVAAVESLVDAEDRSTIRQLDENGDIADPIGLGQAAYDQLSRQLSELIPRRVEEAIST